MPQSGLVAGSPVVASGSAQAAAEKVRAGVSPLDSETKRVNPYVGPRALKIGEPIFGRDRESVDLRDLLIAERIVLLYSPWGAGKTSLIQAGLIPQMEREEFDVLPIIRVGKNPTTLNGNRYVASALVSLEEKLSPTGALLPATELANLSLSDYLEMRKDLLHCGSTLLIFDQFEEILTTDPLDQEEKVEFFGQVGALLRNTGRWALFSIREDYVAALDPYTRAIPTRLKSTFRLDLLTPDGARAAIEQPARRLDVTFAPDATAHLVDDLRRVMVRSRLGNYERRLGPAIEPVHLQVVCFQIWEKPRLNPSEIGAREIAAIGDVDSALGEYYAERVGEIVTETGVKEKVVREWFDRCLITDSGIRTEVMWKPGVGEGLNDDAIDQLEAAHLIRREERRDATWLELTHTRLVAPIRANNARWFEQHLSLLQQQAALWYRQNRNEALCLRGGALGDAEKWAGEHSAELTEIEKEFLITSRDKEKVRSAQRLHRWLVALTAFLTIVSILAIYAWGQRNEAKKQATIASARGLAAHAYRLLSERLDLAMLLAYEASRQADLHQTRSTLLTAVLSNPRLLSFLHGHQSPANALAFTPDDKLLAVGDYKNRIVFWNVETYRPERVLSFTDSKVPIPVIRSIAFSRDKKYMAASKTDGSIVLYDLKSEDVVPLTAQNGHSGNVWSVAFSPDSKWLASAGSDGKVMVWDVGQRTPLLINAPAPSPVPVRAVAFNASGLLLAAGCGDDVVIWQNQGGKWVLFDSFVAHVATQGEKITRRKQVTCVAFSPNDDDLLAFGGKDWEVTLRAVAEKRNVARGRHRDSITGLAFSPNGSALVTAGQDGVLRLWKVPKAIQNPAPIVAEKPSTVEKTADLEAIGPPFTGHVGWILAVAFSNDGRRVASGGVDREAILWDPQYYLPETPNAPQTEADLVMAISPDGRYEATGYPSGAIYCRDRATGAITPTETDHKRVRNVGFSQDGRFLISSSSDSSGGTVRVTDLAAPSSGVARLDIKQNIAFASLSSDGKNVAVGVESGEILLWDVSKPETDRQGLQGLKDAWPYAVAFSPDGKRVAAGGDNQFALIWDLDSHKIAVQLAEEHNGSIRATQFSPDGKILATASGDNTIFLWDATTGKQLGPPLTGHRNPVVTLAFSPDGKMLASGSEDKSVVLWDVETQQQVAPRLVRHLDTVRALEFSRDGNSLFSASFYGDTVVWNLDPTSLPSRCRKRSNRNLTVQEWETYMGKQPYRKTWADLPRPEEDVAKSSR
jgi:WD40 repeat protein